MVAKLILIFLCLVPPAFAARDFNGTTDAIEATTSTVTTEPITFCAWFNSDSDTLSQDIISSSDKDHADQQAHRLNAGGSAAGDPVRAVTGDVNSFPLAASSTGYTIGTWFHGCAVFASSTDRKAYINGGSQGTDVTSGTVSGLDTLLISGVYDATAILTPFDGDIAEVAVWNRALSTGEIAMLGKGYAPSCLAAGLIVYTDLIRDLIDDRGKHSWSATGTTITPHPAIFYCH
jgi:hypothetical protein